MSCTAFFDGSHNFKPTVSADFLHGSYRSAALVHQDVQRPRRCGRTYKHAALALVQRQREVSWTLVHHAIYDTVEQQHFACICCSYILVRNGCRCKGIAFLTNGYVKNGHPCFIVQKKTFQVLCQIFHLYLLLHESTELLSKGFGKFFTMTDEFGRRKTADVAEVGSHVCQIIIPTAPCDIGKRRVSNYKPVKIKKSFF